MSFSDPTLHNNERLAIGWYLGKSGFPLQAIMKRVIDKLIRRGRASHVLFWGGSAGGFASLLFGQQYPRSMSYVWNPQTDVRRYDPRHIQKIGAACFGEPDMERFIDRLPALATCDLVSLYRDRYAGNGVIYLQNLPDWHTRTHAKPYRRDDRRPSAIVGPV
ncbi:MAG TPA: hypothetical protein VG839_03395 [Asticcacaulis sp.]|nr:hypothetical protein [Asticcacaulis sp.]